MATRKKKKQVRRKKKKPVAKKQPTLGSITVTVPQHKRMEAICSIARAVEKLANALATAPTVVVRDCIVTNSKKNGISIGSDENATVTGCVFVDNEFGIELE